MYKAPVTRMGHLVLVLMISRLLVPSAMTAAEDLPAAGRQVAQDFTTTLTRRVGYKYLLFLPRDYNRKRTQQWPLILFLHGSGERGNHLERVAAAGPPKIAAGHPDFPFIVLSPQCREEENWDPEAVMALLDRVLATEKVDRSRVYLTGLSIGGYAAWRIAGSYPEYFAAVAPICGGGDSIDSYLLVGAKKRALVSLGVWAFHGAKDPRVPLAESERMVAVFKAAGVRDIQLTVYPDLEHDAWTVTYDNPELYKWFLSHRQKTE